MTRTSPETTVLDALATRLIEDPDGRYLDFDGVQLSAREMDGAANRIAHGLAALGVGRVTGSRRSSRTRPSRSSASSPP